MHSPGRLCLFTPLWLQPFLCMASLRLESFCAIHTNAHTRTRTRLVASAEISQRNIKSIILHMCWRILIYIYIYIHVYSSSALRVTDGSVLWVYATSSAEVFACRFLCTKVQILFSNILYIPYIRNISLACVSISCKTMLSRKCKRYKCKYSLWRVGEGWAERRTT